MSSRSASDPTSLKDALIPNLPGSMYYIPNFITEDEESRLLANINAVPLPQWRQLAHRRLQAHPSPLNQTNTLLASNLPAWLSDPLIPRLMVLEVFKDAPHGEPNHCLVNEYLPGQGILPHEDGPAYHPIVATVSLGSSAVLDLYPKGDTERSQWRVFQERRSLLITTGEMYNGWLHGIAELEFDVQLEEVVNWGLVDRKMDYAEARSERGTRISLTFRDVLKVKTLKGLSFLGKQTRNSSM